MEVEVSLEKRELHVLGAVLELSNYDIKHLREISGGDSFGNSECERAVLEVVKNQIKPFIKDCGREISSDSVREEIETSFHSHVYVYLNK